MITDETTVEHYDSKAVKLSKRYESADVSALQNKLRSVLKNCSTVLELGCGSGRDAAFLMNSSPERSFSIAVTDGSDKMLTQAEFLHPELAPYMKKLELPEGLKAEKNRYEGIYSIAALMHLPLQKIRQSLQQIAGLLKPAGILFISVCTQREEQLPEDLRLFTLKSREWWIQQIELTGLQVTEATESTDGLNREKTVWLNITAVKQLQI